MSSSVINRLSRLRRPIRLRLSVVSVLGVLLGTLLLVAPASAHSPSHQFAFTFGDGEPNSPTNVNDPYPLSLTVTGERAIASAAVDQATGDVYVPDPGNHRVEKFSPSGHFLLMFGRKVNETAVMTAGSTEAEQDVCTAAEQCQPGASEAKILSEHVLPEPQVVAVDNSPTGQGDVYVWDEQFISKFESSGYPLTGWGGDGVMNTVEYTPGNHSTIGQEASLAVGPTGTLYVLAGVEGDTFFELNQDGTLSARPTQNVIRRGISNSGAFAVDSSGSIFGTASGSETREGGNDGEVIKFAPSALTEIGPLTIDATTGFAIDPSSGELYSSNGTLIQRYDRACEPVLGPCQPLDSFGAGSLFGSSGVAADAADVYVANGNANDVAAFQSITPKVTTEPPTAIHEAAATFAGHIDPNGRGPISACYFEYGTTTTYGHTVECEPETLPYPGSGPTAVTATASFAPLSNLAPGTHYHYRLVAENEAGAIEFGRDETFLPTRPPAIDGLSTGELGATSAQLSALVNPNGLETTYRFQYGTSTIYEGSSEGTLEPANSDQPVDAQLSGLQPGVTYHYRLLAENEAGTTASEDRTFTFSPPACPNESVRQQTHAAYLPDCRAYELVSPSYAGGTQLFPGGPNTGLATSPSRFSYVGTFGTIPGSGGEPIDGFGDLYVATRTATGWVSRYVGLPSSQASLDGGPAEGPPRLVPSTESAGTSNGGTGPSQIQNNVLTDPAMDAFLDFNDGNQGAGGGVGGALENHTPVASNAPYLWGAEGGFRERWPTNLGAAPGGSHALDCPPLEGFHEQEDNDCPGDVTASSDLSHFVFATEANLFAPEGNLTPPGSVYDNDTATGAVAVASKLASGAPIPAPPTDHAGDPLRIPAVSADGSHILIAAGATGPCGSSTCPTPPCGTGSNVVHPCILQPSQLYMRVDEAITYEIAPDHAVSYVGMTSEGSKVFFTSEEHLTGEDEGHSGASLFMWSQKGEEEGDPLTLISKADPGSPAGAGDTGQCHATWTSGCGVLTYTAQPYCQQPGNLGGNCLSDGFIASENGDVYFFSPEQLDGSKGIPDQQNLYLYHDGELRYVTTLTTGSVCPSSGLAGVYCSRGPVVRMEVTPEDSYMAFVTASPLTQYDSAGHLEMYRYQPSTERLVCVSCNPTGAAATNDVQASQDGLYLTDDGRVFFSTEEALVNSDTNRAEDVYEYVEGHPQLVTPGTGDTRQPVVGFNNFADLPGLVGVSANGTDAYFSTFDTLTSQDRNGLFVKFYDARTGGGFPSPAPPTPCEAADECHSEGSTLPPALQGESSAELKPGNADRTSRHRKAKNKQQKRKGKRHHKRAARHNRGGHK